MRKEPGRQLARFAISGELSARRTGQRQIDDNKTVTRI